VIRNSMPYYPIQGQGQGHGGSKVAKMVDFRVYLLKKYLAIMHVIKRLSVNYCTPRECLNVNPTDFLYSCSFGVT